MMKAMNTATPTSQDIEFYRSNGYLLVSGLFSPEECASLRDYFTDMVERGGDGWAEGGVHPDHEDPLKRYPRLLQPHRGDDVAMKYMVDKRICTYLTSFYDKEPLAVQTMVYFKPPGAKGQALHQDQRYLNAEPGTCMAAWLALEDIDEENGCMSIVPGSHELPMLCPGHANMDKSFTDHLVPIPNGLEPIPMVMRTGDMLFFNGSLIHGSGPNISTSRFRRIIVGHYIEGVAEKVAEYYFPVYRFDGSIVEQMDASEYGGPCGILVEKDGEQLIEMTGGLTRATSAH